MKVPRLELPQVRKMFIPDKDHFFLEADLAGADARVAAWECGGAFRDDFLGTAERPPVKIHIETMKYCYPREYALDPRHEPQYTRCKNKAFGTIYGGKPPTISAESGSPLHVVKLFQPWFLRKYPSIPAWHERIEHQIQTKRTVQNAFGYRWIIFDRIDGMLPKALAWIPQSTVAIACFRGILQVRKQVPLARFKLQVHDSGLFQLPLTSWPESLYEVEDVLRVQVPYPEPLKMPWEIKVSARSWGHCKPVDWDNPQLDALGAREDAAA